MEQIYGAIHAEKSSTRIYGVIKKIIPYFFYFLFFYKEMKTRNKDENKK